jgi:hypothetical protein
MRLRTLSLCLALVLPAVAAQPALAVCSLSTLNGHYGYYHGRPGGGSTVTGVVGQISADGAGHLSGTFTMSVNGTISNGSFDGTYTVVSACTGTLTFATEDTGNAHFNIVFDTNHTGFQMIQTDNGFAQPGFALAEGSASCGLKKQTLSTNLLGQLFPSLSIVASVGQLKLDAIGNITGNTETLSIGGTISSGAVTGTYTEGSNCLGTISIASPVPMNFNTVSVNNGGELIMIETDSGAVLTGTAKR